MSGNMDMATRYSYDQRTKAIEAQAKAAKQQAEALEKIANVLIDQTKRGGAFNR